MTGLKIPSLRDYYSGRLFRGPLMHNFWSLFLQKQGAVIGIARMQEAAMQLTSACKNQTDISRAF